jgi:7,8-dihydroneopterin aldolase/epimerase/oxygenase
MSDDRLTVSLTGLEAFGRHGVYPAETDLGQRFVVDVTMTLAASTATLSDGLGDTVDYAALADAVVAIVAGPPVKLIERLAGLIADRALAEPGVAAVEVTVHKPHVAIPHTLTGASVTLRRVATPPA